MKRIILASVTILFGIGAVAAQQVAVNQSKTLMKSNGKNLGGVLSPMVKGEKPYDHAAVTAALAQLDDTAKKLPTLYPESLKGAKAEGDYSPSPKIWENKSDFEAKIASFAKAVTEARAQVKDLDSLKANLPTIGKACSGCHETFRVKNS
ncbi:cytochrome c556 [Nitrobacteraceae bacterium AZCC 1564]